MDRVAPSAVDLPGVLVSKVRAPRRRPGALERRRLLDRLDAAGARLVLLHGPAGAGKTTLARQWVERDGRAASWLTLDRGDDDPVRLVRHVVAAVDGATPVPEVVALAAEASPSVDGAVLPALDQALAAGPDRVLVVDDVHEVGAEAALAVLGRLADLVPDGSTLVLATRSQPGIRWARRVAAGDTFELGWRELAFTGEESTDVVRLALPGTDEGVLAALADRSGGWPAVLQLTVLAVRGRPDGAPPPDGLPIGDGAVLDYFHDEVLAGIDDRDRGFLVRTSVLDELCGALCDEVVGATGSGEVLERLASSENLFVAGLDDDGVWYRYHALFRELLLADLRSRTPQDEPLLRRRAAAWLSGSGHADAAVRQAVATRDAELAGRVALRHLVGCVTTGQSGTVEGWLTAAGEDMVAASPGLGVCAGWVAFLDGRRDEFERRLRQALDVEAADPRCTRDFELARDGLALVTGSGTKETYRAAAGLVANGPDGNPWWMTARLLEAVTGHLLGELPDPRDRLAEVAVAGHDSPTVALVARAQLALAELRLGDREAGQRAALSARADLDAAGLADYPLAAVVPAVAALANAQLGRDESWRRDVDRCRRLLRSIAGGVTRAQAHFRLVLSEAALAGDDVPLARQLLEEAQPFLAVEPDTVVLHDWSDDLRERVRARSGARGGLVGELTDAELRVLEQLASHRTLAEIGEQLYVSRNTVKSHTIAIYRKLGVSGRSAAVEQAAKVGLLDR